MRAYLSHQGAERTLAAKEVAEALLDARALIQGKDGKPDYLGRSRDYRDFVSETLDAADVAKEDRASLQAAIRYHISPMLRERFADEVESLGLSPGSTVERARRRKERDSRILSLFAGGSEVSEVSDVSLIASLSRLALSRVSRLSPSVSATTRARIADEFQRLRDALDAAMERLEGRR